MNKKQLQESIMIGVRRAFKENKSLNESFSTWKDENLAKFDMQTFWANIKGLFQVLLPLMKEKLISGITFSVYAPTLEHKFNVLATIQPNCLDADAAVKEINNGYQTLVHSLGEYNAVKVAEKMNKTIFYIAVDNNSYLWKYILSTLDAVNINGNKRRLKDLDYVQVLIGTDVSTLYIPTTAIMEHLSDLIEYFS